MENPICNTVFDSRDLIEYRDELASDLVDNWNEYKAEIEEGEDLKWAYDIEDVDLTLEGFVDRFEVEIEHYNEIVEFCKESGDYAEDFLYGVAIIHENYFTEYCEELCNECGYISKDFPTWITIDWEDTSENMKVDYTSVTFQGEQYFLR